MLSCPVKKSKIVQTIKDELVKNATSYRISDREVFIPIGENIKSLEATQRVANKKVQDINLKYNGEVFGNVTSLNTTYKDGTGINIHIPFKLLSAYEVKNEQKTLEEFNRDLEYFKGDEALLEQEERETIESTPLTEQELINLNKNLKLAGLGSYTLNKFNNLTKEQQEKIKECYG